MTESVERPHVTNGGECWCGVIVEEVDGATGVFEMNDDGEWVQVNDG